MNITFLGTAAAELYPGAWCQCDFCSYARQQGGRNIRFNSSIHFAEHCLIDFPSDIMNKALRFGVDLLPTQLLMVTHSHEDHFDPMMLYWRYRTYGSEQLPESERYGAPCARFTELPLLRVICNRKTFWRAQRILGDRELADYAMDFIIPEAYREYHHAGVDFIPLIATHQDRDGERGLIYLVHAQGKTFLYATDSDRYIDRTRDCLRHHKVDAVILEATYGLMERGENHMTLARVQQELDFFSDNQLFTGQPRFYLTHMSPHRTPPHDQLVEMLGDGPIIPAYDGMVLSL